MPLKVGSLGTDVAPDAASTSEAGSSAGAAAMLSVAAASDAAVEAGAVGADEQAQRSAAMGRSIFFMTGCVYR